MGDAIRTRELALIHMAKKELAMPEDAYRGLISRFSGGRTDSSAQLQESERREVIEHLRRSGFQPKAGAKPSARDEDARQQARKLRALWLSLYELGVARSPDDHALAGFVARQTGIEALRWNRPEDLRSAIECLKGWSRRVGYKPEASKMDGPCKDRFEPALILAQWERLTSLGAFKHGIHARLDTWLNGQGWAVSDPGWLAIADAQEAVKRLGKWLRRVARGQPDPEADGDA